MPLAYLVSNGAELVVRPVFLGISAVLQCLECKPIDEVSVIENTMQMNMTFIGMDCEKVLVLVFQVLLTHFLADLHSSFGSNFPRFECHNEVLCKDGASACACCCDLSIFFGSLVRITATHICADKPAVVGLFCLSYIGYGFTCCSCDWKYLSCCQIRSTPSMILSMSSR